jgi:hypothetical protein
MRCQDIADREKAPSDESGQAERRLPKIAFVACTEEGNLERQALRLFESIRLYTGRFRGCDIFAISPRPGYGASLRARHRFRELGVQHIDKPLNSTCPYYGSANRVAAGAYVESLGIHDVVVVLDSDTLFLREPTEFLLSDDVDIAMRPVDMQGICSEGREDARDVYWRTLCERFGASLEILPFIESTVDRKRLRASYNGGLVISRTSCGIIQRWAELFFTSIRDGIVPLSSGTVFRAGVGWVTPEAARLWGSNQAALSLAAWSSTSCVSLLPKTYNFPLHLHDAVVKHGDQVRLSDLVHVHYHWLFDPDALKGNPLLVNSEDFPECQRLWLRAQAEVASNG